MTENNKPIFQWSDAYLIGHEVIDEEHKHWFSIGQELSDAITLYEDNKYFVIYAFNQLLDFTETHFRHEEELMCRYQYAHYENHMENHDRLLHKVEDLLEEFRNGQPVLTKETLLFLKEWLTGHFLEEDLKLLMFINEDQRG